mgnify:FL=1
MDKKYKIMNRDQIKYLAIILMTFNHIAHILLPSVRMSYTLITKQWQRQWIFQS